MHFDAYSVAKMRQEKKTNAPNLARIFQIPGRRYDPKICDFGLGRETAEDSDYYRSNDGDMLVPIRWTDPAVLESGKFSVYTDVWAFGVTAIEIFSRGETPYRGWLNTYVVEQTRAGYRMPCPPGCPQVVYRNAILPCWLPVDEAASPRRPDFAIVCAELRRLERKLDEYKTTAVSAETVSEQSGWKTNRAYTPHSTDFPATGAILSKNGYEYEIPVSGDYDTVEDDYEDPFAEPHEAYAPMSSSPIAHGATLNADGASALKAKVHESPDRDAKSLRNVQIETVKAAQASKMYSPMMQNSFDEHGPASVDKVKGNKLNMIVVNHIATENSTPGAIGQSKRKASDKTDVVFGFNDPDKPDRRNVLGPSVTLDI